MFARQTEALTVSVLTAEHHVLSNSSDNHVCLLGHAECFCFVDLLASIHLAVQQRKLPGALVTTFGIFGFNRFCPVAAAGVHEVHTLRHTRLHAFQQSDDVRMVEIRLCHLPEIGHGWERVVATHCPHRVGIRTCDEDILCLFQRQYTIVFQQNY